MIVREDFVDTEDLDGLFSGFDPETRHLRRRRPGSTRAPRSRRRRAARRWPRRRRRGTVPSTSAAQIAGSGGAPIDAEPAPRRHPAAPALRLPGAASGTSPATPRRWCSEVCGIPPATVPAGRRRADAQLGPGAHQRVRATRSAGPTTPSACSTSAPRRSCSCCWATSAAPAAASWRCAGTPPSRAPPTSRRCSTCCPATSRCRTRTASRTSPTFIEADTGDKGFWGNMDAYVVSLLKAWFGDAATPENDYCFDYLPRAHRRPLHASSTVLDQIDGQGARATSCSARTRPSARPTPGMQRHGLANAGVAGGPRLRR